MSDKEIKDRLVSVAIKELIANRWNNLDMKKLSRLSKSPLEDVLLVCSSKHKLLDYWSDNINFEMVKSLSLKELQQVSKKERVLELMLCRFDVIKPKTKEVNALIKLSKRNLIESSYGFNRALKGMKLILDYSDISTKGPLGLIKIKVLTIIWLLSLRDWTKGEISNEEAFMAILHKRLSLAEKVNQIIS